MEDLSKHLKELTNYDPHFRYNSVKSLSQLFIDNINTMKEDDKSKIVSGLLNRLETKEDSLDVKGVTVKEFSRLSKYLKEAEIIQIFSKIIKYITDPKMIGKDIYTTCIKAILKEMPGSSCETVGKIIIPELTEGISSKSMEIKELCFDTFDDFINNFDYILIKDNEKVIKNKENIIKIAIETINFDNASLRKTIGDFLGNFSVILNKTQMSKLVTGLMERICGVKDIRQKIAYLNSLNSVAKISAQKLGEFIPKVLEIIFEFSNTTYLNSNTDNYDENNDLIQASLQIIETFILKNTQILKSYNETIVGLAIELSEYDPNYTYSSEGADEEMYDYNADWGDDYAGGMVLGDDSSWKVRRGAIKVILSFAKSRMELNRDQIDNIITTLVKGLREHDENVKLDICLCLNTFLRNLIVEEKEDKSNEVVGLLKQKSMLKDLTSGIIEPIINSISRELKLKNEKIKGNILQLLSTLPLIESNELVFFLGNIMNDLESSLKENNNYAITVYIFITRLLKNIKSSGISDLRNHLNQIMEWITYGLKHEYYKINIEALNCCFSLIKIIRLLDTSEHTKYSGILFLSIVDKFKLNDIDQELKLTIISTVGNLIYYLGQAIDTGYLETLLNIYLEKMSNDNLRPIVFSWLIKILNFNKSLKNIDKTITKYIPIILDYITKNNLHLQYQSLELLLSISCSYSNALKGYEDSVVKALLSIANDQNNQLLLFIYENLVNLFDNITINTGLIEKSIEETVKILNSSKLFGNSLNPILNYIEKCSKILDSKKITSYLDNLINLPFYNLNQAKAIAILAFSGGVDVQILNTMTEKLSKSKEDSNKKSILLSIGELYLKNRKSPTEVIKILKKMMVSSHDDLRLSISICLGKVGVCDSSLFLEEVIKKLNNETASFYFISVKEFLSIIYEGEHTIDKSLIKEIFAILSNNAINTNDSIRSLCGECLGMILSKQEECFNDYIESLNSPNPLIRSTFLNGLKLIPENTKIRSDYLESITNCLFKGLSDSDLNCKKNAFNSLQNFAHNHPQLIRMRFGELFTIFNLEHKVNPSLIDVVDIGGGMKIKTDKALPIRKSIYSSIKILLEKIPEKFNENETISMSLEGLNDNEDIEAICHNCLLKLVNISPEAFISILDKLLITIEKKLVEAQKTKEGGTEIKVDTKKLFDLSNNVKRLFDELKKVPEIDENAKFTELNLLVRKLFEKFK